MAKEKYAWGVQCGGLLGIYCWFDGGPPNLPKHVRGYTIATFKTRNLARQAAAYENRCCNGERRYRVVKLRITTEVV